MNYKLSFYNKQVDHKGKKYIYNFYTGAIIELPGKNGIDIEATSKEEISLLFEKGFIVEENIDEIKRAEFINLAGKYHTYSLGLTLIPTLECNFKCKYCYEDGAKKSVFMSKSLINRIFEFADTKIKKDKIQEVYLHILGGEALMRPKILKDVLDNIFALKQKHGFKLQTSLITNGYFLTKKMIEQLSFKERINQIQITFDGFEESHDNIRGTVDGKGSFDVIFKNMVDALNKGLNIVVRYNLTENNYDDAKKIMKKLSQLKNKPSMYFGHVKDYSEGACQMVGCMSRSQYSLADIELARYGVSLKLNTNFMPVLFYNHCVADTVNGYTVDPYGNLFKCWNEVGREELSFGNIFDENPILREDNFYKYILDNPFASSCGKCENMPICMGGCPLKRYKGNKDCSKFKFQSDKFVKLYVDTHLDI